MKKSIEILSLDDKKNKKYFDNLVYQKYLIDLNLEDEPPQKNNIKKGGDSNE